MNMQSLTKGEHTLLEGVPGARLIHSPEQVTELINSCFEEGARSLLLYSNNLTERFFDLSSGEAGPILQKLRQYRIKLAVVLLPNGPQPSTMFRELLKEENKGPDFRTFPTREEAEAWLLT